MDVVVSVLKKRGFETMKLSNFRLIEVEGKRMNGELFDRMIALVDVTTGFLWWKRTKTRKIYRRQCGFWHFDDTMEQTPGMRDEELEQGWRAKYGLKTVDEIEEDEKCQDTKR